MRSLPKSTVVSNGKKSAKPVAFAAMFANVPTTKDKGEGKDVKAGNANEVALRRALKIRLDDVVEFDNVCPSLLVLASGTDPDKSRRGRSSRINENKCEKRSDRSNSDSSNRIFSKLPVSPKLELAR